MMITTEEDSLQIIIKGKPINKNHSNNNRGNFGRWSNPIAFERTRYKGAILSQLPKNFKLIPICIPIQVNIKYYIEPSKNEYVPFSTLEDVPYIKKKGDLDNFTKFLLDMGTKTIWEDDTQIYASSQIKLYSSNPRTEIEIKWKNIEKGIDFKIYMECKRILMELQKNQNIDIDKDGDNIIRILYIIYEAGYIRLSDLSKKLIKISAEKRDEILSKLIENKYIKHKMAGFGIYEHRILISLMNC